MYVFTKINDSDIHIETYSLNAYDDQVDMIKQAIKDGKVVGYLQYAVYEDEPYIQLIKVEKEYQRQGVATMLLKDLQKDFPNTSINTGMMTEEGTKLFSKVSVVKKNPLFTKYTNQLAKINQELKEISDKWDWFYENLDKDVYVMSEEEIEQLNNRDQKLKEQKRDLEDKLSRIKSEFTYIK